MSKRDIQDEITCLQDINNRTFGEDARLNELRDMLANWDFDNGDGVGR